MSHAVLFQEDVETGAHLDPSLKEISYNPTFDTLFAPEVRSEQLVQVSSQSFLKAVWLVRSRNKKKNEWFVNTLQTLVAFHPNLITSHLSCITL